MNTTSKHINLSEELSVKILSNRSTARLLFENTQKTSSDNIILNYDNIEFASKPFLDELSALIKDQDEKIYENKNMLEEVKKMDELVQRSQEEKPLNSQSGSNNKTDTVAI